ncbi:MAG: hypothetical protein ACRCXB_09875 [Aeromonadaceae bacterium]
MEWISVNDERKPERFPVLVCYLEPFFGEFTKEIGVGYYDPPDNYENPSEANGWCFWHNDRKIVGGGVTHWANYELP